MTDDKPRSEPSTWEVMRGVERIEKRLDAMTQAFVSVEVHRLLAEDVREAKEQAATDRAAAVAAVDTARSDAAAALATMRTELDNAKKQRGQTWTAIGVIFAGLVATSIYDTFMRGIGAG